MDIIQTQVIHYRYHLAAAVSVSAIVSSVFYAAPQLGTIFAFFWPLLASTALFVAAIIAFTAVSQLSVDAAAHGGSMAGEDIVDYVSGHREFAADEDHKYY